MTRRISRDDLYALVWAKPMSQLGPEFGVTGNGLAKICDRLEIPYPSSGYWAKKAAGAPVVHVELPERSKGIPDHVDIFPTPVKPKPLACVELSPVATAAIAGVTVPETVDRLHPRVKAWIDQHKREQNDRAREIKRHAKDRIYWGRGLLPDLTERDLYRFRATSAIFTAVEKGGGSVLEAPINGKVTFSISKEKVDCSIVEKMLKPIKADPNWTAYPDHHQTGLQSSGFLRVKITSYLGCKDPEWIETEDKRVADLLPEIAAAIISAGPALVRLRHEREESHRRYQEEVAREHQLRREREIDDKRWARFGECAGDWDERARLLAFVAEIKKRIAAEGVTEAGGRPVSEWLAWAEAKIATLDPFAHGVGGLFEAISR